MNATAKTREPGTGIRQIPLAAIRLDPMAQPRAEVDHDLAAEYSEAMAAGETFPPLVVFNDRRTYWLADGFHRHEAAKKAGLREIACVVRSGGLRDAILYSCQANSQHGWRRSNGDKRRAVLTLLADDEWGRWSDREIARHAKVSHEMVRKVRAYLTVNIDSEDAGLRQRKRTYMTRHGTVSTMHTDRIGRCSEAGTPEHVSGEPRLSAQYTVGADHSGTTAWATVKSHVAGLCSVYASPEQIVFACPDPQLRRDLVEMCSHAAELLSGVVEAASQFEELRTPSILAR